MNDAPAQVKDLAVSGLFTDGGHHKQWFLEQILEAIGVDLEDLRAEWPDEWEEGIPP